VLIDIVAYDGLDEMDALGPLEVLRSAAQLGAAFTVRLTTRQEQREVAGAYGLRFVPDTVFEPGVADVLIVPGGGWTAKAGTGAWGEVQRGDWLPLLAEAAYRTRVICGVCTGTMLLAHAGVVGRRRASTHHSARVDLAATGAEVVADRVVDDGDLVTSGGVTSGIDLALWLVEREHGVEIARQVAARMEYSPTRPALPRTGGPAAERVVLRRAVVSEAAQLLALVRSAYRPYVARIGREPAPMTVDYAATVDEADVRVAERGGRIEGLVVMRVADDHLFVENVAVAPRAQRLGIGTQLLQLAEETARAAGLPELAVHERCDDREPRLLPSARLPGDRPAR
jgi:putative intracellular protease/amidase/N-acetylglutamate synthase-like GNAT family acetyltransferase